MQCRFSKARIIDTFFSGLALKWNLRHRGADERTSAQTARIRHFFRCTYKKTAFQHGADVRTPVAVAPKSLTISTLAQLTGAKTAPVSCAS